MKIAQVRFLRNGEVVPLPRGLSYMPRRVREWYVLEKKPYRVVETDQFSSVIFSTHKEGGLPICWREKMAEMLQGLQANGVGIVVPPSEGEFVDGILPLATGERLNGLFAFDAAAEALHRQGRNPENARFLIVGDEEDLIRSVVAGMGDYVNNLAFYTHQPQQIEGLMEQLFFERGLLTEITSSIKSNPFQEADVVLACGTQDLGYEYALKKDAFWLTVCQDRAGLRKLTARRPDVTAVNGLYICKEGQGQWQSCLGEAVLYREDEMFRRFFENETADAINKEEMFQKLKKDGFFVSGFSALGKRVKIAKK